MPATEEPLETARDVAARVLPMAATAAFLPPALVVAVLGFSRPEDGSWPLVASLIALWAAVGVGSRVGSAVLSRLLLLLCALGLFAWPEAGLRVASLRFDSAGVVRFGWPNLESSHGLRKDADLFWTLSPRNADANSRGFPGPEFELEKPPGTRRIIFFGDSCTQQGFPARVERALEQRAARGIQIEAINLGVAGYTSHQGRVLAERYAERARPDLAFVMFGWNDHWLARGSTDAAKSSGTAAALRVLSTQGSRVLQWIGSRGGREQSEILDVPRVSADEYRENLIQIAELVAAAGARAIFLTAPSDHARDGVPEALIADGLATSSATLIDAHDRYNDEVRRLAAFRGYPLIDLAREAEARREIASLFRADGIHLTVAGLNWIASHVVEATLAEKPGWFEAPR